MTYKTELKLLFLSAFTFLMWYIDQLNIIIGFLIYAIIFGVFLITKKPISHFIIVTLFSVMAIQDGIIFDKLDYVVVVMLFLIVLGINIKKVQFSVGNLTIPLVIYFLYNIISILWSPDKLIGLWGIATMLEGYLIYYIITNGNFKIEKSDFINISKIATFIMLTLSAEIIFKYFHYGFANVFSPDGSSKYMVDIGWGYSNLIAVIFLFSIPVALYKYLDKSHYYIGYLFLDLLNLLGLFLTQSRGAYLGAFLSIILFIIFYVRFDFIKKYGSIIALLLIGTFIIPQTREIILHILQKFVNPETFFNVRTDTERIAVLEVGIRKFFDNPIFGTGLKSSRYYIAEIGRERYHYHNFLLQIISTLGVVGFILFIGVVKRVVKVLNKRKEPFIMCITFALVGSLTHQMVDISFDYYYFGLYFYTLIGIVEIYRHHLKDDSVKLKVYNLNDNK